MLEYKDLFNYKKECLFQSLQRNLEWAKRTNEISIHAKNWCLAFWLIYVGILVKDSNVNVSWLQVFVGVLGVMFFFILDSLTHYYSHLWQRQRNELKKILIELPDLEIKELQAVDPFEGKLLLEGKYRTFALMLKNETLIFFYFGLAIMMVFVLTAIKYFVQKS